MTSSEGTDDPEYKNFRDELPDRKLSVNGAVASQAQRQLPLMLVTTTYLR